MLLKCHATNVLCQYQILVELITLFRNQAASNINFQSWMTAVAHGSVGKWQTAILFAFLIHYVFSGEGSGEMTMICHLPNMSYNFVHSIVKHCLFNDLILSFPFWAWYQKNIWMLSITSFSQNKHVNSCFSLWTEYIQSILFSLSGGEY